MPILEVKTKSAAQVWASPDGQRKIYELELEYEGKSVKAKTYSDAIASEGWEGTVETYEKTGRNGIETFVKQPPKEGGFTPQQGGSPGRAYGQGGSSKTFSSDPFTMYLSYAKDLVVAHINTQTKDGSMSLDDSVAAVIHYGNMLYEARPGAETKAVVEDKAPADDAQPVSDDDLSKLDDIFGTSTRVTKKVEE